MNVHNEVILYEQTHKLTTRMQFYEFDQYLKASGCKVNWLNNNAEVEVCGGNEILHFEVHIVH